jgi:hypothetical protein
VLFLIFAKMNEVYDTDFALVLGGGGDKGAFQAGALQYLLSAIDGTESNVLKNLKSATRLNKTIEFSGNSIGALNALLLIHYYKTCNDWSAAAERLVAFWKVGIGVHSWMRRNCLTPWMFLLKLICPCGHEDDHVLPSDTMSRLFGPLYECEGGIRETVGDWPDNIVLRIGVLRVYHPQSEVLYVRFFKHAGKFCHRIENDDAHNTWLSAFGGDQTNVLKSVHFASMSMAGVFKPIYVNYKSSEEEENDFALIDAAGVHTIPRIDASSTREAVYISCVPTIVSRRNGTRSYAHVSSRVAANRLRGGSRFTWVAPERELPDDSFGLRFSPASIANMISRGYQRAKTVFGLRTEQVMKR